MLKDIGYEKGTKVLVFKHARELGIDQDEINFIYGTVQDKKLSSSLTDLGSPWHVYFYKVLGEDGKLYYGSYGTGTVGGSFFRTPEDQIAYLQSRVRLNTDRIKKISKDSADCNEKIAELMVKVMENAAPEDTATPKEVK